MSPKSFEAVRLKFCRDESRQEFCFPPQNIVEIPVKITLLFWLPNSCFPERFWPPMSCFPARISTRFAVGSRRGFGCQDFCFSARILLGSHRDFRQEKKSRRPKSRRDPGRIPVKIAAGPRQDPGPYFTRVSSCKQPPPVSDHLGLTFWVVAYRRFACSLFFVFAQNLTDQMWFSVVHTLINKSWSKCCGLTRRSFVSPQHFD